MTLPGSGAELALLMMDDEELGVCSRVALVDPAAATRRRWAEQHLDLRSLPSPLDEIARVLRAHEPPELSAYRRERYHRTHVGPPEPTATRARLVRLVEDAGFWDHERDDHLALVPKPYAELTSTDCECILDDSAIFYPAELIRHYAPALAEHARNVWNHDHLVPTLLRGRPYLCPGPVVAGLRTAIEHRAPPLGDPIEQMQTSGEASWQRGLQCGPPHAGFLILIASLDPSVADALFQSDAPGPAMTVIEHDTALLHFGWRPEHPDAIEHYEPAAILARLERLSRNEAPRIADAAKHLLQ